MNPLRAPKIEQPELDLGFTDDEIKELEVVETMQQVEKISQLDSHDLVQLRDDILFQVEDMNKTLGLIQSVMSQRGMR